MRRYPPFDPPEYVGWTPDARLVAEYGERPRQDAERRRVIDALDESRC
jgi:hypothetical protein